MVRKNRGPFSDGLTIAERRKLLQVQIREIVAQHGTFVMGVFGDTARPPFTYSIGIPTTFPGASEILICGLNPQTAGVIINNIVSEMREGVLFADGELHDGLIKHFPLYFGRLLPEHYDDYLGQAQVYHHSDTGFPVLQCLWPDPAGRFPWQEGFEERMRAAQPILCEPKD